MKLKNNTRSLSRIGFLVKPSSLKGHFEYAGINDDPIGVVAESVPQGKECEIITVGDAQLYVYTKVRADDTIRQQQSGDRAPKGASMPYIDETEYKIVGKALETGRGLIMAYINFGGGSYVTYEEGYGDELGSPDQDGYLLASTANGVRYWVNGDARYYTKTNLQTSGQAGVHWGNLTNITDPVIDLAGDLTGSVTLTDLGAGPFSLSAALVSESVQDIVGAMVTGNSESGVSVTYQDGDGTLDFNVNDPTIQLLGDVVGSAVMANLGNVNITTTIAANSVALGTDTTGNYVATISAGEGIDVSGSGSETAAVTISGEDATYTNKGIASFANADFDVTSGAVTIRTARIYDLVGGMVAGNTESGIAVTYDDIGAKLNFNVNDPTITLTGDVTGSQVMTNLGNVSITTTIAANSVALGTDTTGDYVATISAGEGIDVVGSGNENAGVTISAEDATDTNKGIASFSATYFDVVNGAVSILSEAIQDITGGMVSSNTETGITVNYNDTTGKLDFYHNDTSSVSSLTALTGADVISDIDFDTYGHTTAINTRTLTLSDLGLTDNSTNWDEAYSWGDHDGLYVSKVTGEPNSFVNDYLYFNHDGATNANNDYISYNDATNAFYFNADTSRVNTSGNAGIVAGSFTKQGGTASQFLKADGSIDSNSYNPTIGTDTDINTSGAQVIDTISLTDGVIISAITTRNLTPGDIGAEAAHSHPYVRNDQSDVIDAGINTTLTLLSDDDGASTLNLYGAGQGTGRVYVGQSITHGGGIEYNGDNSPSTTGAGSDYVTLWRRSNSVDYWTARNLHSNNDWEFRGTVTAPTFSGALDGNALTATALATARNINYVSFDGTSDINFSLVYNSVDGNLSNASLWREGISLMGVSEDNVTYPTGYGLVATFKDANTRLFQLFHNHLGSNRLWVRNQYNYDANAEWSEIYHSDNANKSTVDWAADVLTATTINTGTLAATGAITGTTLNTGQGANELYAMNQAVRTSDSPTFAGATINGNTSISGELTSGNIKVSTTSPLFTLYNSDNDIYHQIEGDTGVGNLAIHADVDGTGGTGQILFKIAGTQYGKFSASGLHVDNITHDGSGTVAITGDLTVSSSLYLPDLSPVSGSLMLTVSSTGVVGAQEIPAPTGGDSLWSSSATGIVYSSGDVAIGGDIIAGTAFSIKHGLGKYSFKGSSATSGYTLEFDVTDDGAFIGHNSSLRDLAFQTDSTTRLRISGTGSTYLMSEASTDTPLYFQEGSTLRGSIRWANTYSGIQINYGSSAYGTSTPAIHIGSNNHVSIGAALNNSTYELYLTGEMYASGDITADNFVLHSDPRLKKNIESVKDGLAIIDQLNPVSFNWKEDDGYDHIGFLTTEVNDIRPELVRHGEEYDGLSYSKFTAINTAAIKELHAQIKELQQTIKELSNGNSTQYGNI